MRFFIHMGFKKSINTKMDTFHLRFIYNYIVSNVIAFKYIVVEIFFNIPYFETKINLTISLDVTHLV